MTAIGCCGRRTSLAGLLAEADFHPASSPQGRAARAKLAYTIAAGKAAQVGNRPAYDRAMRSLGELGGLGLFTSSDPVVTQRSATAVTAAVRAASSTSVSATLTQIGPWADVIASLANLGTAIAGAVPGADQNTINAINTIVSWIRAILRGTAPTIPTLDANLLNGFVMFCAFKPAAWGILNPILVAGVTGLRVQGVRDASAAQAADVLELVRSRLGTMLDGLCAAVAAQAPAPVPGATPANCTAAGAVGDNWVFRPATNECACADGYMSAPGNTCVPIPVGGGYHYVPTPVRIQLRVRCADGSSAPTADLCPRPPPTTKSVIVPLSAAAVAA